MKILQVAKNKGILGSLIFTTIFVVVGITVFFVRYKGTTTRLHKRE